METEPEEETSAEGVSGIVVEFVLRTSRTGAGSSVGVSSEPEEGVSLEPSVGVLDELPLPLSLPLPLPVEPELAAPQRVPISAVG
jgi:hypothetical protein